MEHPDRARYAIPRDVPVAKDQAEWQKVQAFAKMRRDALAAFDAEYPIKIGGK